MREIFAFGIGNTGVLFEASKIRESFACGIRNTRNVLRVGSGIQETFVCGIKNTGNFLLWSIGIFCLLDPGIRKFLFVASEILCLGICN